MPPASTAAPIKTPKTISQITADMSIGACYRFYNVYQYPSNNGLRCYFLGAKVTPLKRMQGNLLSRSRSFSSLFAWRGNRNDVIDGEQANNAKGKILLARKFSGEVSYSLCVFGRYNTEGFATTGKKFYFSFSGVSAQNNIPMRESAKTANEVTVPLGIVERILCTFKVGARRLSCKGFVQLDRPSLIVYCCRVL